MTKQSIKIFSGISIAFFLIFKLLNLDLLDSVSYAVAVGALSEWLYEKWIWQINPLEKTPKIFGKYTANIHSNYKGGTDYTSEITIKQTLSTIHIFEKMDNGYCESVTASLSKLKQNGEWYLFYTYLTNPNSIDDDDIHYGTSILCVESKDKLKGKYFTNRIHPTQGTQEFIKKVD